MSSSYGWIIDHDHIEDNETPVVGPSDISPEIEELLRKGQGQKFRMYDDDRILYYTGRIVGDYSGFEPMDDYGMPNAGCTDIKLYDEKKKEWETL